MAVITRAVLLYLVSTAAEVLAQSSSDANSSSPGGGFSQPPDKVDPKRRAMHIAHGVLATSTFVIFFPMGSILIRLGSSRHILLIHGLIQTLAYIIFTAAFGMGIWIAATTPFVNLFIKYHPLIGILVFSLLFFQPFLGLIHHVNFRKYQRRTVWSYGHLWLGRIVITLGIINGGLGLKFAYDAPSPRPNYDAPSVREMIVYAVVAGIMWLVWCIAAIIGERKRSASLKQANTSSGSDNNADRVVGKEDN